MERLFADIGYKSINHFGEQLCGDHVEVTECDDGGAVIVLADGLGSGVKASILSTLTSKIIATLLAEGLSLKECVTTVAATLPVCSEREVAYSTFTIIKISPDSEAEIIQYDNPKLILLRDGHSYHYSTNEIMISGKKILRTSVKLHVNDTFIAMSDGCTYAGDADTLNFDWERKDIISFMETLAPVGYTAKTLATMLVDECDRLYGHKPGDDTTACIVRMRSRKDVNIAFGPPKLTEDNHLMMSRFFKLPGKHVVCGGTTAAIAGEYLGQPVIPAESHATRLNEDLSIPPTSKIEGVDLVTEGIITMSKVLEYAKDYLGDNELYGDWAFKRDGASLISRMIFEEATHITFYAGQAINPAHLQAGVPISFNVKERIIEELKDCLIEMGKHVIIHKL